ncbi:hypothetical protein [Ruminococcus sp. HUN007]|uniref:hypothetical protein n=1 Tax=Ruminococcus sp. HUN007 TaxID=1514668 RepID=UPI0005D17299|nr:hypothetical protein [Ruminococcus sp. HUN007]
MSFIKKHVSCLLASTLLITASLSLSSCSSNQEIVVKPDGSTDTAVTGAAVTVTEKAEITEPAVTEPEEKLPDLSTVKVKPEQTDDAKYSTVSDYESFLTVRDGFYQLSFLDDKEFEDTINSDIKEASKKLKADYGEEFAYEASRSHSRNVAQAGGIMADVIIRNGFLSVMLEYGYYEPYGTDLAGGYSNLLKNKRTIYCGPRRYAQLRAFNQNKNKQHYRPFL